MQRLWAYAYRVAPAPAREELAALRALLDAENTAAFARARAWEAQLIPEQRGARILVVSDTPAQDRPVNRRLESRLQRLRGAFLVTEPVAIAGDGAQQN